MTLTDVTLCVYITLYRPARREEVSVLVPDPGHRLVAHPGHATVEDGGLAEDGRHVPALGPDELRPRALLVPGHTERHQVNTGGF